MKKDRDVLVPAVHRNLWSHVSKHLEAPDFRHTRKVGLLWETSIPIILAQLCIVPKVDSRKDNCLFYFFGKSLQRKNLHPSFTSRCSTCFGDDLRIHNSEALSICAECGSTQTYFEEHTSFLQGVGPMRSIGYTPSTHPRDYVPCFFKRRNHFRYWLCRMQGKEANQVTRENIMVIEAEVNRFHENVSYESIREALKRLNLPQFYNNIYSIQRSLIGHGLMDLTQKQEDKIVDLFIKIQIPFAEHAGTRVNMFYYGYIIRKLAEILKWPSVAKVMRPLKSTSKTRQLDLIWSQICRDVNLPFYRTV